MAYHYATQDIKGAKAVMTNTPISTKKSIEIANRIRGRQTTFAKRMLEDAIAMVRPIKYTRFTDDLGHKPGMGPGRYPIKTAKAFLALVKSVEANAANLGMNTSALKISAVVVQQGAKRPRYGRHRGRMAKNTHVEIAVVEAETQSKPKTSKKATTPQSGAENK